MMSDITTILRSALKIIQFIVTQPLLIWSRPLFKVQALGYKDLMILDIRMPEWFSPFIKGD